MLISSDKNISITKANQNFSKVIKKANEYGNVVIFKRNKPAYILFDIKIMGEEFLKDFEALKLKHISEKILNKYDEAYNDLAK